ncbi:MAG: BamA/TamA family outer membrane protein, partial [Pseudomonas sp.]
KSDVLYRGHYLRTGDPLDHSRRIDNLSYLQPSAALVFDNSQFGWTGPIQGRRYRAQVSRTLGSFALTEGLLDLRNYWNYKHHFVLATRLTGLARSGADARRFGVYWGGPYHIRGYDANSFHLGSRECQASRTLGTETSLSPCPLRDQLIGSSAAFVNTELRVPVIKEIGLGVLGSLPPVDLVAFLDGGVAWDDKVCLRAHSLAVQRCASGQSHDVDLVWQRQPGQDPFLVREPVFAYGVGLRLNVFYTILRLDYTLPLDRPDRRRLSEGLFTVSFGPSF